MNKDPFDLKVIEQDFCEEFMDSRIDKHIAPLEGNGLMVTLHGPTIWYDSLGDCLPIPVTAQA